MLVLFLPLAFAAGLVTDVTPCILPVLPIILAGGGSGGPPRKPYAIIAGLVASFSAFTLAASSLLSLLHLAQDTLNKLAIALLLVLALTLVVPSLGRLLERPFAFLTRRRGGNLGGGFLLGASLGLVFVPCAGPVLAAVAAAAGTHRIGVGAVLIVLAYSLGAALPMLFIAKGSGHLVAGLRTHQQHLRAAMGVLMAAGAVAIYEGWETSLQTSIGSYIKPVQDAIENNAFAKRELAKLRGGGKTLAARPVVTRASRANLPDYGPAPDFAGISHWLSSPPLTIKALRGRVVLVDFWTYSCINCLRTLPHLRAWYAAYHRDGFEIVGVHTPEFAFEHVLANVRSATRRFGVTWPVALDNDYGTWTAYSNQYWPAEYLVDRRGEVRRVHFGEGEYDQTEAAIRALLAENGTNVLRQMTAVRDETPAELTTPETYLGYDRLQDYVGSPIDRGSPAAYRFPPRIPQNGLAYGGRWTVLADRIVAGARARLRLHFHARDVYIVLGGHGRVESLVDGRPLGSSAVDGDRLYTVLAGARTRDGTLELRFSPGVEAYSFTFG